MMNKLFALLLTLLPLAAMADVPVNAPPSVKLSFVAATKYTDGSVFPTGAVVNYHVFGAEKGGNKVEIGSITATNTNINVGLQVGKEYCYIVYTEVAGVYSAGSNEACKKFLQPGDVTITIT